MRIVFIIDAWYPLIGGGQEYVRQMANRLVVKPDVDVEIVARRIAGEHVEYWLHPDVRLKLIGPAATFHNPFWRIYFIAASIVYLLWRTPADVYVPQSITPGIVGKIISVLRRRPVVLVIHGSVLTMQRVKHTMSYYIERYLLTRIKYTKQITVARNFHEVPNRNKNIQVVSNGVDPDEYSDDVQQTSTPHILFVGRFDRVKRVDLLIDALSKLREWGVTCHLDLVGYGFEEESLRQAVVRQGLQSTVTFHGKVTGARLRHLYQQSWAFVLASDSEGLPLTILEAWAAAIPVIATNVGDIGRYLKTGDNGILIDPGNSDMLADAIRNVITSPERAAMGARGRQLVRERYTWDTTAGALMSLLRGTVTKSAI